MPLDETAIRIAVFETDTLLAMGMCSLLERRSGVRALPVSLRNRSEQGDPKGGMPFDIAIVDPSQSELGPGPIAAILRNEFGARGLISFCSNATIALARACLSAGFRGFLPKTAGLDALETAISAVHGGAVCIDPIFADVFEPQAPLRQPAAVRDLTEREIYVLKSVAHGKSLKEIGQELDLSSKTIETYKARGSSKLNLQGRRAIVEYAIRSGWVQPH